MNRHKDEKRGGWVHLKQNEENDLFLHPSTPPVVERMKSAKRSQRRSARPCSIILICACVCVTFGRMIVSHLGVWGVIFPPVWSHSPDLCKLAVKHIATWPPQCPTHGLLIDTRQATRPLNTHTHTHCCFHFSFKTIKQQISTPVSLSTLNRLFSFLILFSSHHIFFRNTMIQMHACALPPAAREK